MSLSSVAYEFLLKGVGPDEALRVMLDIYMEIMKIKEEREFDSSICNESSDACLFPH